MAHFAELDNESIVLQVVCLSNEVMENEEGQRVEQLGIDFLWTLYGNQTIWKQTSYNTREGVYYIPGTNTPDPDQSKAFRKNYAGIGYLYDEQLDAFIPPKPPDDGGANWVLDEQTCTWVDANQQSIEIGVTRV